MTNTDAEAANRLTDEEKQKLFMEAMQEQIALWQAKASTIKWTTYRSRRAHEKKLKASNRKRNRMARASRRQQRT